MTYTKEQQLEHVNNVITLLESCQSLNEQIRYPCYNLAEVSVDDIFADIFDNKPPEKPVLREVKRPKYPEPQVPYIDTSNKKSMAKTIGMTALFGTCGIGFLLDRADRKEQAKQSPEYQKMVADIDAKYQAECEAARREYDAAIEKYNKDLAEYTEKENAKKLAHNKKIMDLKEALNFEEADLASTVSEHKLIPEYYVDLRKLSEIRDYMADKNSTIDQAIQWFDRQELIREQQRLVREQQRENEIYAQHLAAQREEELYLERRRVSAMEDQAAAMAASARNEKVFGTINAYQQHKRNKMMKDWLKNKNL